MTEGNQPISEFIYHVLLTTSQSKDPRGQIEKIRILGTYTSVDKAKDAAHRGLYDSGYELEWFSTFETNPEALEVIAPSEGTGLAVYAIAADGTKFRIRICTAPNDLQLTTGNEDGRIAIPLYYVVQTNIPYCSHERKPIGTHIEGQFRSYAEARKFASTLLLSEEDGISPSSYQEYFEAGDDETDCDYGQNVVLHAINSNGENFYVSIVTCQEPECVRLAEASVKI
ncbi:uncharacterized protein N7473_012278 [Penicillium subrubescens]|uniref:Uncharacterized protein n=1 Tax=Penicillium subrubescens TaxID=1316194 RepID=A0A1Q5UDX6_9EURO|nr:uncharacterized protein N7473_012278 [Penicillium subrubescens]KAJ5881225.1 hypothetical protein N7473_012278 [Penicillium subrubescens]OKP10653.1 hypothetical protein PENSUB_3956 [Penicillium subrubescens]